MDKLNRLLPRLESLETIQSLSARVSELDKKVDSGFSDQSKINEKFELDINGLKKRVAFLTGVASKNKEDIENRLNDAIKDKNELLIETMISKFAVKITDKLALEIKKQDA